MDSIKCGCLCCCQAPVSVETPDFGALGRDSSPATASASEAEKKGVAAAKGWKGVGEWQASGQKLAQCCCAQCKECM